MVNPTTTRPEKPHKRPALRLRIACAPPWVSMPLHKSDLAIRTERNPHVLIHSLARHRGILRSTNVITLCSETANMRPSCSAL